MKQVKINLAVIAVILGISTAFAFKSPAPKNTSVLYQRMSPTSEIWEPATSSSCESAQDLICKAYFDYDPNTQSKEYNETHADLIVQDNGYVQ